jgi:hypothetical protein
MIRITGTVEYRDGRTEAFAAGTAARAEWELYASRHGLPIDGLPVLAVLVIACYVLTGTLEGFEAWRATVLDVEANPVEGDVVLVPPTLREASGA